MVFGGCIRHASLDRPIRRLFSRFSRPLYDYWWVFVIAPLFISCILGLGFLHMDGEPSNAHYQFTPSNGISWNERKVIEHNWPLEEDEFQPGRSYSYKRFSWVNIKAREPCKDAAHQCNLLDPIYLDAIEQIDEYIVHNVTNSNGTNYSKLCLAWWGDCTRFKSVANLLQNRVEVENQGIIISYPTANTDGNPIYLGFSLGGVEVEPVSNRIKSIKAVRMTYFMKHEPAWINKEALDWEEHLQNFIYGPDENFPNGTLLDRYAFNSKSIDKGVQENLVAGLPLIPLTVLVLLLLGIPFLMIFEKKCQDDVSLRRLASVASTLPLWSVKKESVTSELDVNKESWQIDWVRSKPHLTGLGLLTAGLGIASGIGLLLILGVDFPDHNIVVPFLILAIGVDDMFILVNAWQLSDRTKDVKTRMEHTLSEAAVAITITSVTDSVSFLVGIFTPIPAIQLFCLHAAVCIVFNYLYQVTFFAGLMVLFGKLEHDNRHCFFPWRKVTKTKQSSGIHSNFSSFRRKNSVAPAKPGWINTNLATIAQIPNTLTPSTEDRKQPDPEILHVGSYEESSVDNDTRPPSPISSSTEPSDASSSISSCSRTTSKSESSNDSYMRKFYGPFILHPITKTIITFFFLLYLMISLMGCKQLKEGLDYRDLMMPDNPFIEVLNQEEQYFSKGVQAEIVINKAPGLVDPENRMAIENMVAEFESSPFVLEGGTQFWMREYLKYLNMTGSYVSDTREMWVTLVHDFTTKYAFYKLWSQDIVWNNEDEPELRSIKAFRFRVGAGKFDTPDLQRQTVEELRRISDKYPQYDISSYGGVWWDFSDQYIAVVPNTIKTTCIAMVCMMIVSVIFIPNPICTVWIGITIVSIDIGVVGMMSWWSVNLDAISMITIIMSIGFSVDFAAHIVYGYVCEHVTSNNISLSPNEKVIISLERLGYPLFQAALSTVIGISTLYFTGSNMVNIFIKTIILVVIIGGMHALVFLPVLLSTCMPLMPSCIESCSNDSSKTDLTLNKTHKIQCSAPVLPITKNIVVPP